MNAPAKFRYPTKAAIARAVEAAREVGIEVGGIEVSGDGVIRVLERGASAPKLDSPYERWQASQGC